MTQMVYVIHDFEEKHGVSVNFFDMHEIEEKYGIEPQDLEEHVVDYEGQTLPYTLMVIEDKGKPYFFHARNPQFIEERFIEVRE